ncbi:MAG: hypothetical protein ACLRYM_15305 [Thomasclavelia ramosa]
MVDRNDYKIIINKGKTKEKFFLFLTVGEMGFCLFIGVLSFKFFGMFMSELYSLLIAVVLSASIASLFIEIPVSHLSVLHHLKLACKYYFTLPNQYYYYRDKNKEENIDKEEENSDFYQEERYTASKKTKKADKRNHR